MNKTELFQYIKNVGYPYWELFIIDGFKANRIRNYKLEDIEADASPEEKLNASVNALEITLSTFAPTVKFKITLKNSETANGSGICGPVEFINQAGEAIVSTQPGGFSGLGGLPDLGKINALGYISKSEYDAKLEAMKVANDRAIMEMELRIKEDNLKREYDKKRDDLRKEIEEYRKAREDSQSSINKMVEVVKLAAPPILSQLFGIDFGALSGAPAANTQQAGEVEVKDAKYIEVERLATELYDSKATLEDITKLRNELKRTNYGVYPDNPGSECN